MTIGAFEILLITTTLLEFNPLFQTIKILKLKEIRDVSVLTYIMIFVIGIMWLIYGVSISSLPLIIGNAIKLFASFSVIMVYIVYYKRNKPDLGIS